MSFVPGTEQHARAQRVQERLCGADLGLPNASKELFLQIKKHLLQASDDKRLNSKPEAIMRLLKYTPSKDGQSGAFVITGGNIDRAKDFRRELGPDSLFERNDGALISFSLTLRERARQPVALEGYNFEIRFPAGSPQFLRFDLNPPGHENDDRQMRSHFHPGDDDLQAHAPLFSPLELLDLFLHGLRPRDAGKPRAA